MYGSSGVDAGGLNSVEVDVPGDSHQHPDALEETLQETVLDLDEETQEVDDADREHYQEPDDEVEGP